MERRTRWSALLLLSFPQQISPDALTAGLSHIQGGVPNDPGVIPRAIDQIFDVIDSDPTRETTLRVSYLEVSFCPSLALTGYSEHDQAQLTALTSLLSRYTTRTFAIC